MKFFPQGGAREQELDARKSLASVPNAEYVSDSTKIKHSRGHVNCPLCESVRANPLSSIPRHLPFEEAAALYLASRKIEGLPAGRRRHSGYLAINTEVSYAQYVDSLGLFFRGMPLHKIRECNLRGYQKARLCGEDPFIRPRRPKALPAPSPVKPKKVNQELGLLKLIMHKAHAWTKTLEENYEPLAEEESDLPRALSPEEQQDWLGAARSTPRLELIYWYSIFAIDTCMSTDELRGLRIGDLNLQYRTVTVQRGKVKSRARTIQLANADVLWAAERLLERARERGSVEYAHYLFPFYKGRCDYPQRPMTSSGLKKPWGEVQAVSRILWFKQNGCRHTGITRLAEAGVPIAVIKQRAGHITDKMSAHYTQISESVQRQWMMHAGTSYRTPARAEQRFPPRSVDLERGGGMRQRAG
jgi:integrase